MRDRWVHVRLSEEEASLLSARSIGLGVSKADLIRFFISIPVDYADRIGHASDLVIAVDRKAVGDLVRQLRAWGYHYDHCLHALNTIASRRFMPPDEAEAWMAKAVGELESIDAARGSLERAAWAIAEAPRCPFEPPARR